MTSATKPSCPRRVVVVEYDVKVEMTREQRECLDESRSPLCRLCYKGPLQGLSKGRAPMRNKKKISPSTQRKGDTQFLSLKVTQPLPEIAGAVTVSFKHEDEVHGVVVGPVVVIATKPYDAWIKLHGSAHVNGRGETRHLIPFGSNPEGRYDLGWVTKPVAQEIASHYGAALKEF